MNLYNRLSNAESKEILEKSGEERLYYLFINILKLKTYLFLETTCFLRGLK